MHPELTQFNDWLTCQYNNSSTRKHYMSDLVLFFSWANRPPEAITSQDVDGYIKHCITQRLTPITVNRRLSALRSLYYFLFIVNDVPIQCPVIPKRHFLRKSQSLPRDAQDEQIELLFSHIHDPRDKAMFTLMLESGLRVGEVSDLLLENVLLDDLPQLKVHGKGDKHRIVYLSPPAQKTLQTWLTHRPTTKSRAVFINQRGERLSVSGIQYLLKGYCEKAGIQLTCHQLRHAFGRRMAEANMPVTSLQKLLGHRDVRTTQIYIRLSDTHLQAEYDKAISQVITPPQPASKESNIKRKYSPKPKEINWNGYLKSLPKWLAELIRAFCSRHSQAKDPIQHARNLLSQLSGFARWVVDHRSISSPKDITPRIWFSYTEDRLKAGIKPASLNTTLRILQSFLMYVKDEGIPICERMLEIRPLKTTESLPCDLTLTQLNQLLKQANSIDYAWILLMSHSGLRTCEIRDLRWKDVNLKCRTIRIEESKGLQSRVVFLSLPTLDALKKLPKRAEYVFTYNNRHLSNRYCQSRLKTIGKRCGVKATPHQLRHTAATILLNAGMSVFCVQTILGHKYVDTTLRYARAYDVIVKKDYQQAYFKYFDFHCPSK
jgi:site-specific recombinase XerD